MKIAVLNSSGNCGKSTITKELLAPRLRGCLIVEVETFNDSNINNPNLNIMKYDVNDEVDDLYSKMLKTENVVVDVGASNIAVFFEKVIQFRGSLTIFDYFVIPSVASDTKIIKDTIMTTHFLKSLAVEDEKIKIILNKVENDPETEFNILIKNSPVAIDTQNYIKKSQILAAETPKEKMRLIKMDMSNRMSHSVAKKFDEIFKNIFNQEPVSLFSQAKKLNKYVGV